MYSGIKRGIETCLCEMKVAIMVPGLPVAVLTRHITSKDPGEMV